MKEICLACFVFGPEFSSFLNQNIPSCIQSVNLLKIQVVDRTPNEVELFLYLTEYAFGVKENSKLKPLGKAESISKKERPSSLQT